jgi:hypothetical protein
MAPRTSNSAPPDGAPGLTGLTGLTGGNLRGLLVLNVLLLALLAGVTFAPTADAQNRARGDFSMVAGGVRGAQSAAVYIVDGVNQELMAINYNQNTKRLEGIGYRNLAYDAASRTARRP